MSSMPPPPPYLPTQGSTVGYTRRDLKAQRRAAADQARLQRAQLRMQVRATRRSSIVGPLLLLALGVVLLLLQTGRLHWFDVLSWLGRWWPGVLILAGLLMVAEWSFDRRQISLHGLDNTPRRFLGGGTVALLILLAIVGATVMVAENSSVWIRQNVDENLRQNGLGDWRHVFGWRNEFTDELQAPISSSGLLTIENPRGDVTVTGSSADGKVHVTTHQHVFAWQSSDSDDRRTAEKVRFSGDDKNLVLTAPSMEEDDADLTVELPHDAALTVHSSHGDVTLEELRGAVNVNASGGDIKLTALRGPVKLQTQDDDATVTAHSLAGGLTLDGRTGDIDLSDIDGAVTLRGDFFGTTHLERIRGAVHFQSSFTDFTCAGVPGDVNVEGRSDLDAQRLLGPVTVATTNRNLTLNDVRGSTSITDRNGSVRLTIAGNPQPIHIANENGSVEVSAPAGAGFSVQAHTQNGNIENDFGLSPQKSGDATRLSSQVGHGGPLLDLQTTEGDISLLKGNADDKGDWDDSPKRITPVPVTPSAKRAEPQTDL